MYVCAYCIVVSMLRCSDDYCSQPRVNGDAGQTKGLHDWQSDVIQPPLAARGQRNW